MTQTNETEPRTGKWTCRPAFLAAGLLCLAVAAAWHNSINTPFLFDDISAVCNNPTIRSLWPPWDVLMPPRLSSAGALGRPVVNLSLAVNHALGGTDPRGYHVFNILLHAMAALVLFGVIRRTLLQAPLRGRFGDSALPVALSASLLWAVHPLLTESVTCVVQRNEIIAGIFYLLTLYCFIRSVEPPAARAWRWGAVLACLLGMASKELMVSAPLMVLLYDRTFVSGSFRGAWRSRRPFYCALAATWILLAWVVLVGGGGNRFGTAGFGLGMRWWEYALTQCRAVTTYLKLSLWPHPLVLDYGWDFVRSPLEVLPQALLLLGLAGATLAALLRRSAAGFVGAWFFVILAPSSSVLPLVTQTIAEHRMYLPLASVTVLLAAAIHRLPRLQAALIVAGLAMAAFWFTHQRNNDYRTAVSIWTQTVACRPLNARARNNLGQALQAARRRPEAMEQYMEAVRLHPRFAFAWYNIGSLHALAGRLPEAAENFRRALDIWPAYTAAHFELATVLSHSGDAPEALRHYRAAVRLDPENARMRLTLGIALASGGDMAGALEQLQEALRLDPDMAEAHDALATVLSKTGRMQEAAGHYREAIRLNPGSAASRYNLANALLVQGRVHEAIAEYLAAIRINPCHAGAHANLATVLEAAGRIPEARLHYTEALRLEPGNEAVRARLEKLPQ